MVDDNSAFNMQALMEQAQKMQSELTKIQDELGQKTVEASVGGGLINIVMTCKHQVVDLRVNKEALKESPAVLGDLIAAAYNEATRKIEDYVQGYMKQFTSNFNIPDGVNFPGLGS